MNRLLFALIACLSPLFALAADDEPIINNTAEIRMQIEAEHVYSSDACEATLELEYYQKGASVHVETLLNNEFCAASAGSYVIEVRFRGDTNDTLSVEFEESWAREDDAPVENAKDYFIADNVDVVRVRSRKLRCECTAAPENAETAVIESD